MRLKTAARLGAPLLASAAIVAAVASPANAVFDSGNNITSGGVTYKNHAHSCALYTTSCSWNTDINISQSKSFVATSDVKANGIGVTITISADPSAVITGNSTALAHARESGYGRSNATSGVAKPSIFSVSVAAKNRLSSGNVSLDSGWTTW